MGLRHAIVNFMCFFCHVLTEGMCVIRLAKRLILNALIQEMWETVVELRAFFVEWVGNSDEASWKYAEKRRIAE